jgi:hypothetical protein
MEYDSPLSSYTIQEVQALPGLVISLNHTTLLLEMVNPRISPLIRCDGSTGKVKRDILLIG